VDSFSELLGFWANQTMSRVITMTTKSGRWWLASRGSSPKSWDQFKWEDAPEPDFETAMTKLVQWREQGQHVRLEWIPDGVYPHLQEMEQMLDADRRKLGSVAMLDEYERSFGGT
jgi:hypothetical protein